jgi:ABC-type lipoprotein release transport system permease subunit
MNLVRIKKVLQINFKLCLLEIYSNRARSFITSLGIFLGAASLLLNMAFVRGMNDDMRVNMDQIGGLSMITVKTKEPGDIRERKLFQNSRGLSYKEARQVSKEVAHIKQVLVYKEIGWRRLYKNDKMMHARLFGATTQYMEAKRQPVCIIGRQIVNQLFKSDVQAIGQTIRIDRYSYTIIGIIHTQSINTIRSYDLLIPYSVYEIRFKNDPQQINEITFMLTENSVAGQAASELLLKYKQYHRGVQDVLVETSIDKIKEMESASLGLKMVLWFIAAISLVVGGISIMNIMFATIGDRIRQIGLRKALGAEPFDIFLQFLIEAVLMSFVGGIPGIIVGVGVNFLPQDLFPLIPRLIYMDFLIAIGFIIVAGLVSGLFPALKASRMSPAKALGF